MPYFDFSIPLNVYAHAIYLETGESKYLHYGFNVEQLGIHQAQQNSTDFLISKLSPAPLDILEVGIGLGTTAKQLVKAGYNYTGVVPDSAQIAYCREQNLNVIESRFESMSQQMQYDVILFQESAQYIPAKTLLQKALALLKPTGCLLVLDEIATETIEGLIQLAAQIGFEIVEQQDFTKKATPSLNYLVEVIYQHRSSILQDLRVSSLQLSQLLYDLELRKKAYQEQEYSYLFFKLIPKRA
jgi:SAM-dependent methyltransferase